MLHTDPTDFDIDVDVSGLLATQGRKLVSSVLIDSRWYELMQDRERRAPSVRVALERSFKNAWLQAQWKAATSRPEERRRANRVALVSPVRVTHERPMVSFDVSTTGLRCSGKPTQDLLDVEFKIPGLDFPVDARAEVVGFKPGRVAPVVNLRFVDIDTPYVEHIERYVARQARRAA